MILLDADFALRRPGFSLEVKFSSQEPVLGVFGPSGSGKTTLLQVISGLARPSEGRCVLQGNTLFDCGAGIEVPAHKRRMGFVFQESRLFPHLSVRENLLYGEKILAPKNRRFRLAEVADLLEIGALLERYPHGLSGGEKQRVALGRAILSSPAILLLDEPLASLDRGLKGQILSFLRQIKEKLSIPMLYVSHVLGEILYLTDQLLVLEKGRVMGMGSFTELLAAQKISTMAQRLGIENILAVDVLGQDPEGGTIAAFNGHKLYLPAKPMCPGEKTMVSCRAEDVALSRFPLAKTSIQNQVPAQVVDVSLLGAMAVVRLKAGEQIFFAEVSQKGLNEVRVEAGETLYCLIKSQAFSWPEDG